jgi:hypothetical protein
MYKNILILYSSPKNSLKFRSYNNSIILKKKIILILKKDTKFIKFLTVWQTISGADYAYLEEGFAIVGSAQQWSPTVTLCKKKFLLINIFFTFKLVL